MTRALLPLIIIAVTGPSVPVAAQVGAAPIPTPLVISRVPISSRDRVYAANQTSNTVSVVDPSGPSGGKLLGEIALGAPRTEVLSPIYRGQLNVHGLGFSPDHRTLVVVSIGSNAVTFIDTATNAVKGTAYIGRAPHEAFFTPDGKEVWASVRGEDYLSVIDASSFKETSRIAVASGPGMTLFRPDGRVAFVVSSFTPEVDVVDVATRKIIARIPVVSPFSPDLSVSADGHELWMTHKDVGKVTVIDARAFKVREVIDTGPITNHVALVDRGSERLAFVTIGGLNQVKVFTRGDKAHLLATIPTGALPHGIWPSDDQTRVYVGLENGDGVSVIDVAKRKEIATVPIGQAPQALVYVLGAVPDGPGTTNLSPLGESQRPVVLTLLAEGAPKSGGLVVVRALGLIDTVDVNLFGLEGSKTYVVSVEDGAKRTPLAILKTNPKGGGATQVMGPVRRSMAAGATSTAARRIVVAEDAAGATVRLSAALP
jgi:YVTN family beta-propeller protein